MTITNLALHTLNSASKKANLLSHAFECATQKALNVGDGVKAQLVNIDPQHAINNPRCKRRGMRSKNDSCPC